VGESLKRTSDLSLKDTSNFVLWEYSVCARICDIIYFMAEMLIFARRNIPQSYRTLVWETS
jgi:hypothetical protein